MTQTNDSIRISLPKSEVAGDSSPPGLHLNFLTADDFILCEKKQYVASRQQKDMYVMEVKGTFESDWHIELPAQPDCFWLLFQFAGHSQRDKAQHTALSIDGYRGFYGMSRPQRIGIKTGRVWMVLLGLNIDNAKAFTSEWPLLKKPTTAAQPYFSRINIGYRIKQIFKKMRQFADTPYSLHGKIQDHFCQLTDVYHQDLHDKVRSLHKEDIVIYHEAIEYITEHYMDEDINIDTIAERIHVSSRKLYRAFQDKHMTVHKAIQTIRLHKGRELLRETDDSIDIIAFQLNFSTAHYFYKQFVQCFGHSPTKEREMYRKSKKKKKRGAL